MSEHENPGIKEDKTKKTTNDQTEKNVTLDSENGYSDPTGVDEPKIRTHKISDLAASKIRLMFKERDAITLEYSKKIDLFIFGILEGFGIDRSKIISIDFNKMEVLVDNTQDN